jgi:hypothetical protein
MQAAALAHRAVAAALVVAASLGACACSSGDGATPTSVTTPTTTAEVIVPTDPPTTTQVPNEATPLVRQAVLDYWAAQQRCQERPQSCRPVTFTATQGTIRADVQSSVDTLVANGWRRAVTAEGAPADGYVVVGPITVAGDATTAVAEECVYDPAPLVDRNGVVVSAVAVAHHITHTLYLEDGTWKVGDEQVDPSSACDDAPEVAPPAVTVTAPDGP